MKYIEVKKNALRLMGVIPDTVLGLYSESNIRDYLIGMDESILRAIDRMRILGKLPSSTKRLDSVEDSGYYSLPIFSTIGSGEVLSVWRRVGCEMVSVPFAIMEGNIYVYLDKDGVYYVDYMVSINPPIDDEKDIPIPDELARIIPYYIKADLYEEEEPSLSAQSRNVFEGYLEEYRYGADTSTQGVRVIYRI